MASLPGTNGYEEAFMRVTGLRPYPYQVRVARELIAGHHIVVRAPTGAGKGWSVLAPFVGDVWSARPRRLIYALPLRTLAQGIYRQARGGRQEVRVSRRTTGRAREPLLSHHVPRSGGD